jgi:hypothetical protein
MVTEYCSRNEVENAVAYMKVIVQCSINQERGEICTKISKNLSLFKQFV